MINVEKYLNFLIENKLTQSQFLLLHLVYTKDYDSMELYKKTFPTGDGTIIGRQATDILLERGLLLNNKGKPEVSEYFKSFYTDDIKVVEEIFNEYPDFVMKENGVKVPLTASDRTLFRRVYLDKILHSNEEHKDIILDIKYGKKNNLIKIGLDKFLHSEYWKVLRKQRLSEQIKESEDLIDEDERDF